MSSNHPYLQFFYRTQEAVAAALFERARCRLCFDTGIASTWTGPTGALATQEDWDAGHIGIGKEPCPNGCKPPEETAQRIKETRP